MLKMALWKFSPSGFVPERILIDMIDLSRNTKGHGNSLTPSVAQSSIVFTMFDVKYSLGNK